VFIKRHNAMKDFLGEVVKPFIFPHKHMHMREKLPSGSTEIYETAE